MRLVAALLDLAHRGPRWVAMLSILVPSLVWAQITSESGGPASTEIGESEFAEVSDDDFGESEHELSAAQAIAEMERRRRRHQSAIARARITNLKVFEYELEGPDENELMTQAMVKGLKATASQLYFGNYIIIGRDLLEAYLKTYGERFIARREVMQRRILANGHFRERIKIGVNIDAFYSDLNEKHFIATPKLRPFVTVLLAETVAGLPNAETPGRKLLEQTLANQEFNIASDRMAYYGLNINVSAGPELMKEARDEAQRNDIDVIVTGSLEVTPREDEIILFDQIYHTEGRLILNLIRVDTGEILRKSDLAYSAAGPSEQEAFDNLLQEMIPRGAEELTRNFLPEWSHTMLDIDDYRLLITGVNPEALTSVTDLLRALSPRVEIYIKAYYGDVVTLNMIYPGAGPGELEQFLRKSKIPQFRVRAADSRRFELSIL